MAEEALGRLEGLCARVGGVAEREGGAVRGRLGRTVRVYVAAGRLPSGHSGVVVEVAGEAAGLVRRAPMGFEVRGGFGAASLDRSSYLVVEGEASGFTARVVERWDGRKTIVLELE